MSNVDFLQQVITAEGFVTASVLAKVLHITQTDLAQVTGLSIDAVSKSARLKSRATFAWFRSQPLPSFGDKTAEDLVKEGRADAVKAYLSRIADGGYA